VRASRFTLLCVMTLVAVLIAGGMVAFSGESLLGGEAEGPAFPRLAGQGDAVAEIEVATVLGSYRLTKDAEGDWTAPEKGGFPADRAAVRRLLVSLQQLRLYQRKTRDPERLPRLHLSALERPESQAKLVTLRDASGTVMAEAYIGRSRADLAELGEDGTYIRYPGENQAWLALGSADVPSRITGLLDSVLTTLPSEAIRRVEILPTDGEALVLQRLVRGARTLDLVPPPAPGQSADQAALRQIAGSLQALRFVDVAPVEAAGLNEPGARAVFVSFDGIEITLHLAERDGSPWMELTARYVSPGEGAAHAEETQAFVAALSARTAGWVFQIDPWIFQRLSSSRDDVFATAGN